MKEESLNLWRSIKEETISEVNRGGTLKHTAQILKIIKDNFDPKAKFVKCGNTWIGWVLQIDKEYESITHERNLKEYKEYKEHEEAEIKNKELDKLIKKEILKHPKMFDDRGLPLPYGSPEYEAKKLEKEAKVKKMLIKEKKKKKKLNKNGIS